jgi:purine-binding chemotaxis protein CheW
LKRLLKAGESTVGSDSRLIVFKAELGDPFGVLVDRIGDIVTLHDEQVEANDSEGGSEQALIRSIGKLESDLIVLLDARQLLPHIAQAGTERRTTEEAL